MAKYIIFASVTATLGFIGANLIASAVKAHHNTTQGS
jgi:hypothetical protein